MSVRGNRGLQAATPWPGPQFRPPALVRACLVLGLASVLAGTRPAAAAATGVVFAADLAAFCRAPHRLAGTVACREAADYAAGQLRAAGLTNVFVQTFDVPQVEGDVALTVDDRPVPVFTMSENLWSLPGVGDPIVGETLYAGDGSPEAYGAADPAGRIVVLDYARAVRWRDAFALGARAVVFVEPDPSGTVPAGGVHSELIGADQARFYVRRSDAVAAGLLVSGHRARLASSLHWVSAEACNVVAWLPGAAPRFGLERDEAVVLAAQLDSFGDVPRLATGARGAANCAALLAQARAFAAQPPARGVLIAFLGGEARCLAGSSALYSAIFRQRPFLTYQRTHADLIREYRAERDFLEQMAAKLAAPDVLAGRGGEAGRQALDRLRREAEVQATERRTRLRELRTAQAAGSAALAAALADEQAWNELRRAVGRGHATPDVQAVLDTCRGLVLRALQSRSAELDTLIRQRGEAQQIGSWLAGRAIVLHLDLDFGDNGPRWGLSQRDDAGVLDNYANNNAGFYVGVFGAFNDVVQRAAGSGLRWLEPATVQVQLGSELYCPGRTLSGGQLASRFGVYGLRLATCHDPLQHSGHPQDDLQHLDAARIEQFACDAQPLLTGLASDAVFSLRQRIRPSVFYADPEWNGARIQGYNLMARSGMGALANRPARGAWVSKIGQAEVPGFDTAARFHADQNGSYAPGPPCANTASEYGRWSVVLCGSNGQVCCVNAAVRDLRRIELFPCRNLTITSLAPPIFPSVGSLALNAVNDGPFPATDSLTIERGAVATFFVPAEARSVKIVNTYGLTLLNSDARHPAGRGLPVAGPSSWRDLTPDATSAQDLYLLNESRLDVLRRRRITNDSLEWLHGLAGQAQQAVATAPTTAERTAFTRVAALLSRRVYAPLLATINDLVQAVVILLLLTIPFAFALERLLIGTPHIYQQIGWYGFFFLLMFAVLYGVHPAFAIAAEPAIIFLAFAIILLSSLVMFILLNRFQAEIKVLQGMRATVHAADVSRFGTLMAAVAMGISTMRRRRVRTLLTTVTVVLLTFSILSFASFDAQQGVLRRYVGAVSATRGLFIHQALWTELPEGDLDLARHEAGAGSAVTARRWLAASSATEAETFGVLVATSNGSATVQLKGLVGLEPADVQRQSDLQACLPTLPAGAAFAEDLIFLPPAASVGLGVRAGDPVRVGGRAYRFAGAFDVNNLTRFTQIDQAPLFPVDFSDKTLADQEAALFQAPDRAAATESANQKAESAYLPYLGASQIALVHVRSLTAMPGSRLVGISIYPDERTDLRRLAEKRVRTSWAPVYVTQPDGVYRLYFTTVLSAAGLGNIIIPILLGGLIVLGTMLGSVADRTKEISTFSALGLAPIHIAMLFFAEAAVYAVVGGLGGYTLAQSLALGTGWIARHIGLTLPEMNYSSNNAIFAILVVMATVLLSTIYPAFRGARSANAGVVHAWRLPKPRGDTWEFAFPFTVSDYDSQGVMAFLHEHFSSFGDCSLGVFLAENVAIRRAGRSLVLDSRIATTPFDLGVTEDFSLSSFPSEIPGVDEVRIAIRRRSGTDGDWRRTNRPFIANLRKQFLLWRALPAATMEIYRKRTEALLGGEATHHG